MVVLGKKLAENLDVELGDKVVYTLMDRSGDIVGGMARVSGLVGTGAASRDGNLVLLPITRVREVLGYGPEEAARCRRSAAGGEVVHLIRDESPTASDLHATYCREG